MDARRLSSGRGRRKAMSAGLLRPARMESMKGAAAAGSKTRRPPSPVTKIGKGILIILVLGRLVAAMRPLVRIRPVAGGSMMNPRRGVTAQWMISL